MGDTHRESFASPLGWVLPKDDCYDVALEEDSDNAGPHNTATGYEQHYLMDGCIWGLARLGCHR